MVDSINLMTASIIPLLKLSESLGLPNKSPLDKVEESKGP